MLKPQHLAKIFLGELSQPLYYYQNRFLQPKGTDFIEVSKDGLTMQVAKFVNALSASGSYNGNITKRLVDNVVYNLTILTYVTELPETPAAAGAQ